MEKAPTHPQKNQFFGPPNLGPKDILGPYPLVIRHGLLETTTYIHDDFPVMDISFDLLLIYYYYYIIYYDISFI